ncbi:MAG: alanine dehydrogenase [Tissierellia bacterium]|nr:alanine dehydrogenase [Tissierellia bacterium]
MKFGLLKDTKIGEHRTILTPLEIGTLVSDGQDVYVQKDAGTLAGFPDEAYVKSGATILDTAEEMYAQCDFVTKVKEIEPWEFGLLREGQIIFTCIHPASYYDQVSAILESKCIAFTAEDSHRYGSPNCEAAGKAGALKGLQYLETNNGGKGKYVGGLAGSPSINVLILGAGNVGKAALSVLTNLGAKCTVFDINIGTMRELELQYAGRVDTMLSTKENIASLLPQTDLVINSVKWQKDRTDHLIERDMLKLMEKGSVIVDISADENGAIETYRETSHDDPIYVIDGIIHYGVSNIPSVIAHSTSQAYAVSVLGHMRSIMKHGVKEACVRDGYLRRSMASYKGYLTHEETSALQKRPWIQPEVILGIEDRVLDPAPYATVTRSENYLDASSISLGDIE